MTDCPCELDRRVDPVCAAAGMCAREPNMRWMLRDGVIFKRAELGVDGTAGFALLGPDIQAGEAEFVTVATDAPKYTAGWEISARRAATKAYKILKDRVPYQFSYYLGDSYPK